jgi:hypothetical protein
MQRAGSRLFITMDRKSQGPSGRNHGAADGMFLFPRGSFSLNPWPGLIVYTIVRPLTGDWEELSPRRIASCSGDGSGEEQSNRIGPQGFCKYFLASRCRGMHLDRSMKALACLIGLLADRNSGGGLDRSNKGKKRMNERRKRKNERRKKEGSQSTDGLFTDECRTSPLGSSPPPSTDQQSIRADCSCDTAHLVAGSDPLFTATPSTVRARRLDATAIKSWSMMSRPAIQGVRCPRFPLSQESGLRARRVW